MNERPASGRLTIGLLWFNVDPHVSPVVKIIEACDAYMRRFGRQATHCHVTPGLQVEVPGVTLIADPYIRPNFFWVGRIERKR